MVRNLVPCSAKMFEMQHRDNFMLSLLYHLSLAFNLITVQIIIAAKNRSAMNEIKYIIRMCLSQQRRSKF